MADDTVRSLPRGAVEKATARALPAPLVDSANAQAKGCGTNPVQVLDLEIEPILRGSL
eukprot:CAMPEP_0180834176 /NCGR_PEP_ID=MMETSP1038_2-20121128/77724_1 /TAXON_ID=632150 /ORGANISM="Azadinium spinosum, Strain 3D9" /LENGTH=57 /DNA_ID=CAMNT_0022877407 /DNA_START=358 /DNA_END=527 /DNA_ORIENTATION=+